jgi:hypothetical protein
MNPASYLAYSVCVIEFGHIGARVSRRLQSRAASELLSALEAQAPFATVHSKSHSRAVAAVAVGRMDDLQLGIDIEWVGAKRPVESIASYLQWEDRDPVTQEAFYRGWTFAEAYYKAFQRLPEKSLAVRAMKEGANGRTIQMEGGIGVFQTRVFQDFQLSLVWKGATPEPVVPTYVAPPRV